MIVAEPAFAPAPRPRPALRVVQDGEQDCSTCRNMHACWKRDIEDQAIITNLLVCRIKRGIEREKATRVFLKLIRPKLLRMGKWVATRTGMPLRDAVAEMESVAVESLIRDYSMGERVPPIVWLFNEKLGSVRHWAVRTVAVARKQRSRCLSYGGIGSEANVQATSDSGTDIADLETRLIRLNYIATGNRVHSAPPGIADEPEARNGDIEELCARALEIVHDGQTLPVTEYRILKFYMMNARENEQRMLDWVHKHMCGVLGLQTQSVSRLYGLAYRRLLDAVGLSKQYLAKRGIKTNIPKRRSDSESRSWLTADEIIETLRVVDEAKTNGDATYIDIAWALGMTDMTLLNVRKRYAGKTPDEIRAMCGRKK
jgi:hypothetical protein